MHLYIHIIVRINKQRDKSFEFSSILSAVDLSKHLITARQFVTFSVFFFLFVVSDRGVWLNLYERAPSGNEQLPFIKTFVREFSQCRPFFVFYTDSVMLCPRFIPSRCFIPSP